MFAQFLKLTCLLVDGVDSTKQFIFQMVTVTGS